jgi:hypothetical protein
MSPTNFKSADPGEIFQINAPQKSGRHLTFSNSEAIRQLIQPSEVRIVENQEYAGGPRKLRLQLRQEALYVEVMIQRSINENSGTLLLAGQAGEILAFANNFLVFGIQLIQEL